MKKFLTIVLLACTFLSVTHVKAISAPINSFETLADMSQVTARSAVFSQAPTSATDGRSALKVVFQPAAWSDLILKMSKPLDFSNTAGLSFDVSNPGDDGLQLGVEMIDANGKACALHVLVNAGMTNTFHVLLGGAEAPSAMPYGMQTLPSPTTKVTSIMLPGNAILDTAHIVSIWFYQWQVSTPQTLIFDNLNFVPQNPSLGQIVDRFGQYTGSTWEGKLTSDEELASRRIIEENTFSALTAMPDRDEFGGWKSGPSLAASGFFRTVKTNGKWWLVTPTGHLFFSVGLDGIDFNDPTTVAGREYMFSWLPNSTSSLADAYGTGGMSATGTASQSTTFDFYKANLERKYGSNYLPNFLSTAMSRIQSWGFNTIGNSSTGRLYRNGRVPYALRVNISGTYNHVYSGSDHWGPMHDPFDPRFAAAVAQSLQAVVPQVKTDPWLLGYFIDNELSWASGGTFGRYGLVYGTLQQDVASSPAKQALISDLRTSYGTIAKLNIAWATQFTSWDDLGRPYTAPATPPRLMPVDMSRFMLRYARQYFSIVRTELKKQDASHLYLGCRFGNYYTPEVLQAASENCDVMSFNIYELQVSPDKWNFLTAYNKPCIIGEFQSGSRESGMFSPGLVAVQNKQARGSMYENYVRSVLDNPTFVGCHWFRYVDEPLTGRAQDGENGNFGFVDVTDTPYPELVNAARNVNSDIYSERYGPSN